MDEHRSPAGARGGPDRESRPNTSARITFDFTPKTWLVRRGKLFLSRRRSFFANHSQFDLSPVKSYSPNSVPRYTEVTRLSGHLGFSDLGCCEHRVTAGREPKVDLASRGQSRSEMCHLELAPKESYQLGSSQERTYGR